MSSNECTTSNARVGIINPIISRVWALLAWAGHIQAYPPGRDPSASEWGEYLSGLVDFTRVGLVTHTPIDLQYRLSECTTRSEGTSDWRVVLSVRGTPPAG